MARGSGSVKLSIYSTYDDKGTKQAERAMRQFTKAYGEVDKATGKVKLDPVAEQLARTSIELDQCSAKWAEYEAKITAAGTAITKYVSGPAAALMGASILVADQWDTAFAKVKTIMDPEAVGFEDMSRGLLDLSTASGRSADELAEAAYQAMSASVATEDTVGFVSQAVDLSKAGFTDTATAVDTLTTIMNAYGLSAEDAARISDELVQTQNKGKTTVGELAASMGTVIPTAAAFGVNLENLNTAYVELTKQGINTANATTYLNGMFNELADEGSEVSKVLKGQTGKSFTELMQDGSSLGDVIQILYDSVEGDSTAFANLWGNMRAGKGALAIANAGVDEFNTQLAGMDDAAGNVQDALDKLVTPGYRAREAVNALKNTGIELGEQFLGAAAPMLEDMSSAAKGLYEAFANLDEGTKQNIARAVAFAAALGPGVLAVGKFAGLMSTATKAAGKLSAGLAKMAAEGAMSAGKANVAAKAMSGLAKAMSPATVATGGLVAVLGVALVAVLLDAKKKADNAKKSTEGLTRAVQRSIQPVSAAGLAFEGYTTDLQRNRVSLDEAREAGAKLAEEIEERNRATETQIARLQGAKEIIDEYNGVTGLSAQQQGELRAAVDLVNESCGTEYEVIDAANGVIADQEGAILDTTAAIDGYIQKKQEEIRLNSLEETLTGLYEQQAVQVAAVGDAYDRLSVAKQHVEDIKAGRATGDIMAETRAVEQLEAQYSAAVAELENTNAAIDNVTTAIGTLEVAQEGAEVSAGKWAAAQQAVIQNLNPEDLQGFAQAIDEMGISVEDMSSLSQEELIQLAIAWRTGTGDMEQMIKDFKNTAGKEGGATGEAYAEGIEGSKDEANAAGAALNSEALSGLQSGDPYATGEDFAYGYAGGMNSSAATAAVRSAARSMAQTAIQEVKNTQVSASPSKVMREVGQWFGEGYAEGITLETADAAKTAAGLARAAVDAATIPAPHTTLKWPQTASQALSAGITRVEMAQLLAKLGDAGGTTYNITLNGATLNDTPAMREAAINLLTELMRVGAMQGALEV